MAREEDECGRAHAATHVDAPNRSQTQLDGVNDGVIDVEVAAVGEEENLDRLTQIRLEVLVFAVPIENLVNDIESVLCDIIVDPNLAVFNAAIIVEKFGCGQRTVLAFSWKTPQNMRDALLGQIRMSSTSLSVTGFCSWMRDGME